MFETWALHSPRDKCLAAPHIINSSFSMDVTPMGPCNQTLARKTKISISRVPSQKTQQRGSMKQKTGTCHQRSGTPLGTHQCLSPSESSCMVSSLSRRKDQPEEQDSPVAQGSSVFLAVPATFPSIILESGHSKQCTCQPQHCWLFHFA